MTSPVGAHPPMTDASTSPVAAALAAWLSADHISSDTPLLVACSGGADSLALAWALHAVITARSSTRMLMGTVVDHQLQPGSTAVAHTAASQLRDIGYRDVHILPVEVTGDGGMEAAARNARYSALAHLAAQTGAAVLLGHTADDQAETVLLGLGRGSGPRSIAGMRSWRPPWGRPLLTVRRFETEAACAAAGMTPWQDPHNSDPTFTRVRLRSEVMPLLDDVLNGGVVPALVRTAALMADDLTALDDLAAELLATATTTVGELLIAPLVSAPAALRSRVLRSWVASEMSVTTLTYQHLRRLDKLVTHHKNGAAVRLPGGADVVRRRSTLAWQPGDGKVDL